MSHSKSICVLLISPTRLGILYWLKDWSRRKRHLFLICTEVQWALVGGRPCGGGKAPLPGQPWGPESTRPRQAWLLPCRCSRRGWSWMCRSPRIYFKAILPVTGFFPLFMAVALCSRFYFKTNKKKPNIKPASKQWGKREPKMEACRSVCCSV